MTVVSGFSPAKAPGFTFDGVHSRTFGIYLLRSDFSGMPATVDQYKDIPGRHGAHDFGFRFDTRKIPLECFVLAQSESHLRSKLREIATWLDPSKGERQLVLDTEPDRYYLARVAGSFDVEIVAGQGRITIPFVASKPFAYSFDEKVLIIGAGEETGTAFNDGTADAFPVITAIVRQPITFFAVVSADRQVILGRPNTVTQTPRDEVAKILDDQLESMDGWGAGVAVDGGVISGAFQSDGVDLRVQSFGTGTQWHGPAVKKTLPEQAQDFRVTVWLSLDNRNNKVGRLECYLLDQNDGVIGKIALVDSYSAMDNVRAEARAGTLSSGHYFVNEHGDKPGVWNNFHGVIQIERRGNVWKAFIGKYDYQKRQFHSRRTAQYVDVKNQYSTKQLAAVQLHAGAYGTHPPAPMWFNAVIVEKFYTIQPQEVPNIATAGDELVIDCERAVVLRNGFLSMELLDVASEFLRLPPRTGSIIGVTPSDAADVVVTWRERWL